MSTFDSLPSLPVESEEDEAGQNHAHRYSPAITKCTAFITLQCAASFQDVKRIT
jgi:hypothetical protein